MSAAQSSLFLFEDPVNSPTTPKKTRKSKPDPQRTAKLQEIAKSLGVGLVKEPQPPATGGTWSDDAQISQPHYKREIIDTDLFYFEED